MQINATQAAGIVAFGVAALLAFAAARATRRDSRAWNVIAAINLLFAAEVVAMTRHRLSLAAAHWLVELDDYVGRRAPQLMLIIGLAILGLYVAVRVLDRLRRSSVPLRGAAMATIATATLFAIETVSLHQVDGMLYHPVGPVRAIGVLWLALGLSTALLALAATGRKG
ncbi:hypothetical protein [Sphingomonas nostoxanthinifaciens]|uniref:hypothetical protein n=1 Tax=Sphingomonas nostoxanthinifaciens TaxID=2872652 RepID=UPI001CC1D1A9|nr:hypothetical protein [Sphingomonas nostoxanthinifaciens]UAK25109.1 hypothetical protein K8P63_02560 [Sphingomonas nostoxanthinifaciens]